MDYIESIESKDKKVQSDLSAIEKNRGIQTPPFITKNNGVKLRFKTDLVKKFGL